MILARGGQMMGGLVWLIVDYRLLIIDISSSVQQPIQDASGELSMVFSGEIYNYRELQKELISKGYTFSSQSDTEGFIASYLEWGVQCLSRFNGMFSYALFDKTAQKMFLARDRTGEKPLFYSFSNEESLSPDEGAPSIPARVVIGALIIKHMKVTNFLVNTYFPVAWWAYKAPYICRYLVRLLPLAFRCPDGIREQSREWSLLDTFDNLSPRCDNPMTEI